MLTSAYRLLTSLIHKLPLPRGKLAQSIEGRRTAAERWLEWTSLNRTTRPLVWVHGASVGEALTATPVIRRLRSAVPGITIVHSHTSPSTVAWRRMLGTDRSDYLPSDEAAVLAKVFDCVTPDLIVCSRGDLWPQFAHTASSRGVPIAIISATVRASSRRLWPVVRSSMRRVYEQVRWLGAASCSDAERWAQLGVPNEFIVVTGDTRHEQVLERISDLAPIRTLLSWSSGKPTMVAGSTDIRDETVLLSAFRQISETIQDSRLVLVPHVCSEERIAEVLSAAARRNLAAYVWTGEELPPQARCVVVKAVGMLADIYAAGGVAYVGGGFRSGGLHAVSEPAAFALPVIVGPEYEDASDATLVVEAGGAFPIPRSGAECRIEEVWLKLLSETPDRANTGLCARRAIRGGAASTTTAALVRLLAEHV